MYRIAKFSLCSIKRIQWHSENLKDAIITEILYTFGSNAPGATVLKINPKVEQYFAMLTLNVKVTVRDNWYIIILL